MALQERELKRKQKEFLKKYYFDYRPERHDAYVIRYQKEQEAAALEQYEINREINS